MSFVHEAESSATCDGEMDRENDQVDGGGMSKGGSIDKGECIVEGGVADGVKVCAHVEVDNTSSRISCHEGLLW